MRKTILLCSIVLFTIYTPLKAQYLITDKDGYTNIREQPNAQSKIVETVKKYQVFYAAADIPCNDEEIPDNKGNWLLISSNMKNSAGYIYKKVLYPLNSMPMLKEKTENDIFVLYNDSIKVTLKLQPFDKKMHNIKWTKTEQGESFPESIDGGRAYGTDGWLPHKEIQSITISCNGKNQLLPKSKFKRYYDPSEIIVRVGLQGELYIHLSGGDGSGGYEVDLSVVNGDIMYSLVSEC